MRADEIDACDGLELARSLMELKRDVGERLEASAESRLRLADSLGDGTDATALERVQVEHPIRLAEAQRAEDDGLGAVGARHANQSRVGNGFARSRVSPSVRPIRLYTTRWCGYCVRAKALLDSRGLAYEEVSLDDDPAFRQHLFDLTGGWTVPQIVIGDEPIGGYTELWRLDRTGRLGEKVAA